MIFFISQILLLMFHAFIQSVEWIFIIPYYSGRGSKNVSINSKSRIVPLYFNSFYSIKGFLVQFKYYLIVELIKKVNLT